VRAPTSERPPARPTKKVGETAAKTAKTPPRLQEPPIPRQGFEADTEPGIPVQPPSSSELAASVVELVGELAQAGLSTGGRLLKDALTRLPGI
jgi:hypothetical protein